MKRTPRHPRGFTLLELVLVLGLLSLIFAMAAPSVRGFGRGQNVEHAADRLLADAARARSDAAIEAMTYRLQLDPLGGGYVVLRGDADEQVGEAVTFGDDVRLDALGGDGAPIDFLEFSPDGRVTPVVLTLLGHEDRQVVLEAVGTADSLQRRPREVVR